KLVPRHRFEQLAQKHHHGQRFRRTSRWSQFVALAMGQLSGRCSLRDIVENAEAQVRRWYHLGVRSIKRSTLSRVNNEQPAQLYEELFGLLYERCRGLAPRHRFRFKHPLYSLDASVIELSLRIFPWAKYLHTKGGMKVHLSLDHSGYIPSFAVLTDGCKNEAPVGRQFDFPPGSVVVFDRGYTDYLWYKSLTHRGIYFVTRLRKNARYTVLERRRVDRRSGLTSDQTIRLTGPQLRGVDMPLMRHVGYRDPETGKHYAFLTNAFHLSARTIAELYKERWQIELFFKWIKQNLKIKAFVGTSRSRCLRCSSPAFRDDPSSICSVLRHRYPPPRCLPSRRCSKRRGQQWSAPDFPPAFPSFRPGRVLTPISWRLWMQTPYRRCRI